MFTVQAAKQVNDGNAFLDGLSPLLARFFDAIPAMVQSYSEFEESRTIHSGPLSGLLGNLN